jgi:hypothetical protein
MHMGFGGMCGVMLWHDMWCRKNATSFRTRGLAKSGLHQAGKGEVRRKVSPPAGRASIYEYLAIEWGDCHSV